jgi:protein SCO1
MRWRLDRLGVAGATVAVVTVAALVLWKLTAGLSLFTSESWRRAAVVASPRPLPAAMLEDEQGRTMNLSDLCGKILVVDFVYTRCPTVCKSLGSVSSQLAQRLADPIREGRVEVLSLSFDPERDTPEQLQKFKRASDPQSSAWRLARPTGPAARAGLLERFGVIVIDDGYGGFEHNAALHVVDRQCRLARVLDVGDVDNAQAVVHEYL